MKKNLYLLMIMFASVIMAACSDDDDNGGDVGPQPMPEKSYVSRIIVTDLNTENAKGKTLKFLYDRQKRITAISWGGTVPGRDTWKITYTANRIDIRYSGEAADNRRYCNIGADSIVNSIFESTADETSETHLTYTDGRITGSELRASALHGSYAAVSSFTWKGSNISNVEERYTKGVTDSLLITHKMIYDEFAPNNTNIDFNAVLDALNAMSVHHSEAPAILGMLGSRSSQLILRHTQTNTYPDENIPGVESGYQVLSYSVQEGRIANMEIENEHSGTHLKLNVVYKSDK